MTPFTVEAVGPQDAEAIVSFLNTTPDNLFDPEMLAYPLTQTAKSMRGEKVVAFLPAQITLTLDAFAMNPDATKREKAKAMYDLFRHFERIAQTLSVREMNFFVKEETTANFAAIRGVEEIKNVRIFRYKVPSQA